GRRLFWCRRGGARDRGRRVQSGLRRAGWRNRGLQRGRGHRSAWRGRKEAGAGPGGTAGGGRGGSFLWETGRPHVNGSQGMSGRIVGGELLFGWQRGRRLKPSVSFFLQHSKLTNRRRDESRRGTHS